MHMKYSDSARPLRIFSPKSAAAERSLLSLKISRARLLKVGLANFSKDFSKLLAKASSLPCLYERKALYFKNI